MAAAHTSKFPLYPKIGILVITFAYTSYLKSQSMEQLTASVDASLLVPLQLSYFVSVCIVVWEVLMALGLAIPRTRVLALWATIATLLGFMAYAVWRYVNHIEAPCNCFGTIFKLSPFTSLSLCTILLFIAASSLNQVRGGGADRVSSREESRALPA